MSAAPGPEERRSRMLQALDLLWKFTVLVILVYAVHKLWPVIALLLRVLNHIAQWVGS